jgi:hypothetical protein
MKLLHDRNHNNMKLLHDRNHNNTKLRRNRRANLRRNRSSKNDGKNRTVYGDSALRFPSVAPGRASTEMASRKRWISIRSLGND